MAICTQCGAIMHEDDAPKHECRTQDKPTKGIMKVNNKEIDIKTGIEI